MQFSALGRGKALSVRRRDPLRMSVVKALPELVRVAVPIRRDTSREPRRADAYVRAVAPVRVGERVYAVQLLMREVVQLSGREVFYTFEGYDLEEVAGGGRANGLQPSPPGPPSAAAPQAPSAAGRAVAPGDQPASPPESGATVADLVAAVNQGRPVFQAGLGGEFAAD